MPVLNQKELNNTLENLRDQKGRLCITIIAPVHHYATDKKVDRLHLEKLINFAKESLENEYYPEARQHVATLDELFRQVDYKMLLDGIGFYVSDEFSCIIDFSFPVNEKVYISDSFQLKEVLYGIQMSVPYFVLLLEENKARLFNGGLRKLTEVNDLNFPFHFMDDYEYEHPSRGTSYQGNSVLKSFEKDSTIVSRIRFESFLKKVDHLIDQYIDSKNFLVVCGVKKNTAAFLNRSKHADKIAALIHGNYGTSGEQELAELVWPSVHSYLKVQMEDLISDLEEKRGEGLSKEGIEDVWEAVHEGRGLTLILEKDLSQPGYLIKGIDYQVFINKPSKPYNTIADVINPLIEKTIENKGKVIMVENGMLDNHNHVALITRF